MAKSLSLTLPGQLNDVEIQVPKGVPTGGLQTDGTSAIHLALNLAFLAAIILTFLLLLWGGFQWITSAGDKSKIQAARKRIYFAVIGLVVVFLSIFIISVIGAVFGIDHFGLK